MAKRDEKERVPINHFDPDINAAAMAILTNQLDANSARTVATAIGQHVARYRHAKGADWITPTDARAKADRVAELLRELYNLTSQPDALPPEFRAYLSAELREHSEKVSWPDLPRLIVVAERAAARMPAPVKGKKFGKDERDASIRGAYAAVRDAAPGMSVTQARSLAADVIASALDIKVPADQGELAAIIGEK